MTFDELYRAIKLDRIEVLKEFLDAGGDPNLKNDNDWTLLMSAAFVGRSRSVAVLLTSGAEVNFGNKFGESALALAAAKGHLKCVEALVLAGASVAVKPGGCNLLEYLEKCACPSQRVKDLLVSYGAV